MAILRKCGCCCLVVLCPLVAILAIAIFCNVWVTWSTGDRVYHSPDQIENQSVALVLGTSKKVGPDTPNPHFENRIKAAADLFKQGKIEQILVSGYRDSRYYDEAKDMETRLREHQIPEAAIMTDDKGNRTLDSIERAFSIHELDKVIIVSDDFTCIARSSSLTEGASMRSPWLRKRSPSANPLRPAFANTSRESKRSLICM